MRSSPAKPARSALSSGRAVADVPGPWSRRGTATTTPRTDPDAVLRNSGRLPPAGVVGLGAGRRGGSGLRRWARPGPRRRSRADFGCTGDERDRRFAADASGGTWAAGPQHRRLQRDLLDVRDRGGRACRRLRHRGDDRDRQRRGADRGRPRPLPRHHHSVAVGCRGFAAGGATPVERIRRPRRCRHTGTDAEPRLRQRLHGRPHGHRPRPCGARELWFHGYARPRLQPSTGADVHHRHGGRPAVGRGGLVGGGGGARPGGGRASIRPAARGRRGGRRRTDGRCPPRSADDRDGADPDAQASGSGVRVLPRLLGVSAGKPARRRCAGL